MSPFTFANLISQAQAAQGLSWIQTLPSWIPLAACNILITLVVTLLGALYRSEQKRQHAQLLNVLKGYSERVKKEVFEEADKRYQRIRGFAGWPTNAKQQG